MPRWEVWACLCVCLAAAAGDEQRLLSQLYAGGGDDNGTATTWNATSSTSSWSDASASSGSDEPPGTQLGEACRPEVRNSTLSSEPPPLDHTVIQWRPRCRGDGSWELMQCGAVWCWCVSALGVPVRNSAQSKAPAESPDPERCAPAGTILQDALSTGVVLLLVGCMVLMVVVLSALCIIRRSHGHAAYMNEVLVTAEHDDVSDDEADTHRDTGPAFRPPPSPPIAKLQPGFSPEENDSLLQIPEATSSGRAGRSGLDRSGQTSSGKLHAAVPNPLRGSLATPTRPKACALQPPKANSPLHAVNPSAAPTESPVRPPPDASPTTSSGEASPAHTAPLQQGVTKGGMYIAPLQPPPPAQKKARGASQQPHNPSTNVPVRV
eukprot:TRINITY_DN22915_c0_g1_i1.p1 TRINITY_DN22915_c0_g1~~TRINITY_DN22915_c0_g1_i1.p1  ORF type:complete len:379 (+),score=57.55 TRINITY_DN22915_c0_g1_i1:115-1251(+)